MKMAIMICSLITSKPFCPVDVAFVKVNEDVLLRSETLCPVAKQDRRHRVGD